MNGRMRIHSDGKRKEQKESRPFATRAPVRGPNTEHVADQPSLTLRHPPHPTGSVAHTSVDVRGMLVHTLFLVRLAPHVFVHLIV